VRLALLSRRRKPSRKREARLRAHANDQPANPRPGTGMYQVRSRRTLRQVRHDRLVHKRVDYFVAAAAARVGLTGENDDGVE
jgi:hypothetical protein